MARYLVKRILTAVVTLFTISVATFWLFFAIPADPAALQCGKGCNPAQLAQIRTLLGLDRPTPVLYAEYMKGIVAGRTIGQGETARQCPAPCFGFSFITGEPVFAMLRRAIPVSASIVGGAAVIWLFGGVTLGVLSALRRGSWIDKAAIGFSLIGASTQIYFLGLVLQLIFTFTLHWLPNPGYVSPFSDPLGWVRGMLLAWVTLAFINSALYARMTRAQMIETLSEDFVRTARAKGLSRRQVQLRHALRAALTPIVTLAGIDIGVALGSTVITETVFAMQGMGKLAVEAVATMNLPIIMATVLLAATFIVVANLVVDLLYLVIDPRVKLA